MPNTVLSNNFIKYFGIIVVVVCSIIIIFIFYLIIYFSVNKFSPKDIILTYDENKEYYEKNKEIMLGKSGVSISMVNKIENKVVNSAFKTKGTYSLDEDTKQETADISVENNSYNLSTTTENTSQSTYDNDSGYNYSSYSRGSMNTDSEIGTIIH